MAKSRAEIERDYRLRNPDKIREKNKRAYEKKKTLLRELLELKDELERVIEEREAEVSS